MKKLYNIIDAIQIQQTKKFGEQMAKEIVFKVTEEELDVVGSGPEGPYIVLPSEDSIERFGTPAESTQEKEFRYLLAESAVKIVHISEKLLNTVCGKR